MELDPRTGERVELGSLLQEASGLAQSPPRPSHPRVARNGPLQGA